MRISLAQFDPTADFTANAEVMTRLTRRAAAAGSDLIVFSEEAMLTADAVTDAPLAEVVARTWPEFTELCLGLSKEHNLAVIAGGYEPSDSAMPYNTIFVAEAGAALGAYRKMHLYDAFHYQESRRITRGDTGGLVISIGGFNIGLVNCYDLRFPEFTRSLIEMGADVLSVSAAWVHGPLKEDHWSTLLRARAIENTCWVLAASLSSDVCIGRSMIIDPLGVVRGALGEEREGLLTGEMDKDRTEHARSIVPVLRNRRIFINAS